MSDLAIISICTTVVLVAGITAWTLCYPRYLFHRETENERERQMEREKIAQSDRYVGMLPPPG